MRVTSIAAVATNGVIGKDNDLVWKLRDDMQFFMDTTRGHHVIMGRRNFESIPAKYRPLADRPNVVISRNAAYEAPVAVVVTSLEAALEYIQEGEFVETGSPDWLPLSTSACIWLRPYPGL